MVALICMFILTLCSGFCEGVMNKLQFHYHKSIFMNFSNTMFWNPLYSWKNKYKNGNPGHGPRFFLSTTWLVALTDGWHLFKLLRNVLLFASLPIAGYYAHSTLALIIIIVLCRTAYGAGFWLSYYKILRPA